MGDLVEKVFSNVSPNWPSEHNNDQATEKEAQKRRGRKRIADEQYFKIAERRIQKYRDILKTAKEDGLSVKERQMLRNKISA